MLCVPPWEQWVLLPSPMGPCAPLLPLPRALLPLVPHPGPSIRPFCEAEPSGPGRCSRVSKEGFVCVAVPQLLARSWWSSPAPFTPPWSL